MKAFLEKLLNYVTNHHSYIISFLLGFGLSACISHISIELSVFIPLMIFAVYHSLCYFKLDDFKTRNLWFKIVGIFINIMLLIIFDILFGIL